MGKVLRQKLGIRFPGFRISCSQPNLLEIIETLKLSLSIKNDTKHVLHPGHYQKGELTRQFDPNMEEWGRLTKTWPPAFGQACYLNDQILLFLTNFGKALSERLLTVSKTFWKAKRTILAKLFPDMHPSKYLLWLWESHFLKSCSRWLDIVSYFEYLGELFKTLN